ncbi:MAG: hypothetical protein C0408_07530, partial [Odoribacter sp.]|nr:hypothetical protein [Odoribacter sp.]
MIFISSSFAQKSLHDFGFSRNQNLPVLDSSSNAYLKAWAGGLNYCQFMQIDLNMDGIKDMVIFDRTSTRIITFINNNIPDSTSYTYAPQFAKRFPVIQYWMQLQDYNCDGKEDLFFHYAGGIVVYKNVSNLTDSLKFSLVTNQLLSLQGIIYTNIMVSQVDYPAIADIDNDGDLDILNFFGMGTWVEYHRNLSMEDFGNCDSLKYFREERCWGNFMENGWTNSITLGIGPCLWKNETTSNPPVDYPDQSGIKHSGSTMLAIDLDGDADKDLILGDVTYPNLIALTNGGTTDSANMVSVDTLFPVYDQPVHFFSFPVPCYIDVDNDGVKDLTVSPFASEPTYYENFNSVWLYKNDGTNSSPVFHLQKKNFLQGDMIDVGAGAYPVLYDYDGDNLSDLFVANFAYYDSSYFSTDSLTLGILYNFCTSRITLFKNIGTAGIPQFKLITRDFANLGAKKLNAIYPAFGDLDGDGDADMIIGDYKGNLYRYENTAGIGNPMVMTYHDSLSIDVGWYSTPQLIDLDRDSLIDLVVGEKSGNLNYYKNTGTEFNPVFTLVNDSLGHIDVIE